MRAPQFSPSIVCRIRSREVVVHCRADCAANLATFDGRWQRHRVPFGSGTDRLPATPLTGAARHVRRAPSGYLALVSPPRLARRTATSTVHCHCNAMVSHPRKLHATGLGGPCDPLWANLALRTSLPRSRQSHRLSISTLAAPVTSCMRPRDWLSHSAYDREAPCELVSIGQIVSWRHPRSAVAAA